MSAVRAGIYTFNERALIPTENYDWDTYDSRLFRYALNEAYKSNTVYREITTFSLRLKASSNLYKFTRGIYSPADRLVEAYVAKVYGGGLDFEDLSAGAIPVVMPPAQLKAAIRQLWLWSNWRGQKSVYVRQGATLGDVALKIVDEPDKGKVRMEVLHPGKISEVTFDAVKNIKAITIEYERLDENDRPYTYREVWGEDQTVATFKGAEPHAFYNNANGTPVAKWDNPYGFIPVVLVQHKDVGLQWGANAFQGQLGKIDELNDAASVLNDQVRKAVNVMWYFAGVAKRDELTPTNDDKDKFPAVYGPKESQPYPMIAQIDIAAAGANVDRLLAELERDMPELSMHRLREGGNATAPGVRSAYSDAVDRFIEAQGTYDDGLIRAHKMAISIGGYRGYDGFRGYNLGSFAKGDLEHYIKDRPIIEDTLSKTERLAALQAAGAPIWLVMEELDYDQLTIDRVVAEKEKAARDAVRQFTKSTFGDDDDEEDDAPADTEEDEETPADARAPAVA